MSLRVWLPLNGDLRNQGLDNVVVTSNGVTIDNNGKIGKCYSFDGQDDYIKIEHNNIQNLSQGDLSFSFWCYNNDSGNRSIYIATIPSSGYAFAIEKSTSQQLRVYWQSNPDYYPSNFYIPVGKWSHIAVVIKNSNCYCYLNGEKIAEKTDGSFTSAKITNTWNYIMLGRDLRTGATVLNGKLNDVRIYDHALSQQEIKKLAQGLIVHYPLNNRGMGQENLLSEYVTCGSAVSPSSTTDGGRTTYYGRYGINIPAQTSADTYFGLWITQELEQNTVYTISCLVDGIKQGTYYNFPLFAQGNSSMGILKLDHNGINSLTFTMNYTGSLSSATFNGKTYYRIFMDDITRKIVSEQGEIHVRGFKLEKGNIATPFAFSSTDTEYTKYKLNDNNVKDISGFNNNAEYVNDFTFNSDTPMYNISTVFNGLSCIKNNNFILPGKIWTVSCWYYKPTNPTTYEGLFCLSRNAGADADKKFAAMPNKSRIWYKGETGTTSIAELELSKWTFLAMVCDGTVVKVYQNNEIIGSFNAGNEITDANDLVIGARAASVDAESTSVYFTGQMSDFRIYATALSADDIKELYEYRS